MYAYARSLRQSTGNRIRASFRVLSRKLALTCLEFLQASHGVDGAAETFRGCIQRSIADELLDPIQKLEGFRIATLGLQLPGLQHQQLGVFVNGLLR